MKNNFKATTTSRWTCPSSSQGCQDQDQALNKFVKVFALWRRFAVHWNGRSGWCRHRMWVQAARLRNSPVGAPAPDSSPTLCPLRCRSCHPGLLLPGSLILLVPNPPNPLRLLRRAPLPHRSAPIPNASPLPPPWVTKVRSCGLTPSLVVLDFVFVLWWWWWMDLVFFGADGHDDDDRGFLDLLVAVVVSLARPGFGKERVFLVIGDSWFWFWSWWYDDDRGLLDLLVVGGVKPIHSLGTLDTWLSGSVVLGYCCWWWACALADDR